ncbi:hypothetical protein A7P54_14385 [Acinetobacter sp. Ac_3412]|nr:hypothetical protein [Acinetobacter sp. Ac_3412]
MVLRGFRAVDKAAIGGKGKAVLSLKNKSVGASSKRPKVEVTIFMVQRDAKEESLILITLVVSININKSDKTFIPICATVLKI